jgi:hypothetical protein
MKEFVFNYTGTLDNATKLVDAAGDLPVAVKELIKSRIVAKGADYQHSVSTRGTEVGDTYAFTLSVKSVLPVNRGHVETPTRLDNHPSQ